LAAEMGRTETERAEVQDLWEKVEGSKEGLASVDAKTFEELERRKKDLDEAYLRLTGREEDVRKDEQHLEEEWDRLRSIQDDLTQLAEVLKAREDELKKTDGGA
jgi:chromosome segregation ATPase